MGGFHFLVLKLFYNGTIFFFSSFISCFSSFSSFISSLAVCNYFANLNLVFLWFVCRDKYAPSLSGIYINIVSASFSLRFYWLCINNFPDSIGCSSLFKDVCFQKNFSICSLVQSLGTPTYTTFNVTLIQYKNKKL